MKARRQGEAVCVLVSGGLDSAVLVHAMAQRFALVFPLYVRAGLRWEPVEEYWLKRFLKATASRNGNGAIQPLTVARLPVADVYGRHWSLTGRGVPGAGSADRAVYLPGRNLLLLSKAAVFCALRDVPAVALGPLKGNPFPDATADFFRGFARLASRALESPLRVLTPFAHLSKTLKEKGVTPLAAMPTTTSPARARRRISRAPCAASSSAPSAERNTARWPPAITA